MPPTKISVISTEKVPFRSKYLLNLTYKIRKCFIILKYNKTNNPRRGETWMYYCLNREGVTNG